eukprot:504474-Rhodomonas_salina.2
MGVAGAGLSTMICEVYARRNQMHFPAFSVPVVPEMGLISPRGGIKCTYPLLSTSSTRNAFDSTASRTALGHSTALQNQMHITYSLYQESGESRLISRALAGDFGADFRAPPPRLQTRYLVTLNPVRLLCCYGMSGTNLSTAVETPSRCGKSWYTSWGTANSTGLVLTVERIWYGAWGTESRAYLVRSVWY